MLAELPIEILFEIVSGVCDLRTRLALRSSCKTLCHTVTCNLKLYASIVFHMKPNGSSDIIITAGKNPSEYARAWRPSVDYRPLRPFNAEEIDEIQNVCSNHMFQYIWNINISFIKFNNYSFRKIRALKTEHTCIIFEKCNFSEVTDFGNMTGYQRAVFKHSDLCELSRKSCGDYE